MGDEFKVILADGVRAIDISRGIVRNLKFIHRCSTIARLSTTSDMNMLARIADLKDPFRHKARRKISSCKLQRWKKFWQTGSCRKDAALGNTNKTLGVKNFISAFILLLCGMLICSLILLLEHVVHRYFRVQLRRTMDAKFCSIIAAKGPQQNHDKSQHTPLWSHRCNDPECLAEVKRLQTETQQLREKLRRLESMPTETISSRTIPTTTTVMNKSRPTSAVGSVERELIGDKAAARSDLDEKVLFGESRVKPENVLVKPESAKGSTRSSSRERGKLWDIYSKVAVIPIETDSTPLKYSCGAHYPDKPTKSAAEKDTKILIIPRLTASPKRRQPAAETSFTVVDSNAATHSPRIPRKAAHTHAERLSPKKERIQYVTPTGSHISIQLPETGVTVKDTARSMPRVRVQDHMEAPLSPGSQIQESSMRRDSYQSNDRPTEPKRQKREHGAEKIPPDLKTTPVVTDTKGKSTEGKKHRELRFEKAEPHFERTTRSGHPSTSVTEESNFHDPLNASKVSSSQTLVEKESVL